MSDYDDDDRREDSKFKLIMLGVLWSLTPLYLGWKFSKGLPSLGCTTSVKTDIYGNTNTIKKDFDPNGLQRIIVTIIFALIVYLLPGIAIKAIVESCQKPKAAVATEEVVEDVTTNVVENAEQPYSADDKTDK